MPESTLKLRGSKVNRSQSTAASGEPVMSSSLKGTAARCWRRLADDMRDRGILSVTFSDVMEMYSRTYAELAELDKLIATEGFIATSSTGATYQNPTVGIRNKAAERLLRLSKELGITPASIGSVATSKRQTDDLDDFLARDFA